MILLHKMFQLLTIFRKCIVKDQTSPMPDDAL